MSVAGNIFKTTAKYIVWLFFFCLLELVPGKWIENAEASIVLKAAVVNPSPEIEKEVEIKVPLPKEIMPEHILGSGDLEIRFDNQKNVYFGYKKITLSPKGSVIKEIEVQDVWVIDEEELKLISEDAERLWLVCKNSNLANQASFLKNSIDSKINQIIQSQDKVALNPQAHISNYRKNVENLTEIKAAVESLTQIASRVKPVSAGAIWRLILLVVGFLILVSLGFIFVWFKYMKKPELEKLKSAEEVEDEL